MEDLHTRMCKKIADLTRVIDRLFRQYYEQNILFLTLKNDRERHQHSIDQEQAQLKEQEMKRLRETVQQLEGELSRINTCKLSMKKEMLHLETTLEANSILLQKTSTENSSIKQEINSLRQKLEDEQECQACTERAHQLVEVEIKIVNQLNELKRLNVCNNTLEQEKVSLDRELGVRQRKAEWLECELASVQSLLDQYQSENKELKSTISCLEEKLLKSTKPSCKPSPVDPFLIKQKRERQYWLETAPKGKDVTDLDKLKQEVLRYKMELANRETNFNRVFSTPSSIHLQSKTTPSSLKQQRDYLQLPKLHSSSSSSHKQRLL